MSVTVEVKELYRFVYLGVSVAKDDGGTSDIRKRIAISGSSFSRLGNSWKVANINKDFSKILGLSILLCGCETCKLLTHEYRGKEDRFLPDKMHKEGQQHLSNLTVLETAETSNISGEIRRRRWNRIGHILRKDPADDCAVAQGWTTEGRRKTRRPKTMW